MAPPREITDDYRLEKILASSRSGSILRASAIATGQTVVIKLIHPPAPADPFQASRLAARFNAYATALAGLWHPNLPVVLDSGVTADGGAFLVMEMLDGISFEDAVGTAAAAVAGDGGASPDRILPLLGQALAGMEDLARHGLAHLNLCPENLFLIGAGPAPAGDASPTPGSGPPAAAPPTVKLLGLGTALFHLGDPWPDAAGARFRAPELAAPAAALQETLDWHADCYSLALTACYALGATVAVGEDGGQLVQTVQMPLALRFELANDEALRQILERCLRQSARERPAPGAIRDAFSLALGEAALPAGAASFGDRRGAGEPAGEHGDGVRHGDGGQEAGVERGGDGPDLGPVGDLGGQAPGAVVPAAAPGPARRLLADLTEAEPALFGAQPAADWRSALAGSPAPPAPPRWREEPAFAGFSEHGAAGGREEAEAVGTLETPAPSGESGEALLDLFDVPEILPALAELEVPPPYAMPPPAALAPAGSGRGTREAAAAAALPLDAGAGLPHAGSLPGKSVPAAGPRAAGEPVGAGSAAGARLGGAPAAAAPTSHSAPAGAKAASPEGAAAKAGDAPPPGELLSAVDELLSSLPPPPAVVASSPVAARGGRGAGGSAGAAGVVGGQGARGAMGAAVAAAAAPAAGGRAGIRLPAPLRALPWPVLLGGGGLLLLAAGLAAWWLVGHGLRHAPPGPAAAGAPESASPPLRPGRSAAAKFDDARSLLIFGKESDGRVRQALRELTFADQGELGPEGCQQLAAIQQMLAISALETVQQDLAVGLRTGDLGLLESVVEVASGRDLPPNQQGDLERARTLVEQYRLARAAAARGDPAGVLERCRAMAGLSRTLRDPLELRDQAAQAIEAEALALARDGSYDQAVAHLDPILRNWPERAGIKDLVKSYQAAAASELQQQAILDSVPAYESRRRPSEALDLLRPLQPTPHLEQRIAAARQQLEAQLAQLDAQPPEVTLRPGYVLDYSRGTTINLSFRVTDDYEVKSVKLFARVDSGSPRELPLQKSVFGWDVSIPASIHENETVNLWVVATDLSGHEGMLGTKENPLQVKRRQGFEQLLH